MPDFIGRPRFFENLANILVKLTAEKYAPIEQGLQGVGQGVNTMATAQQKELDRKNDMSDKVKLAGINLVGKLLDEGKLEILEKKGIDLNALLPGLTKTQELAPGIAPAQPKPGVGQFPQGLQPQPITTQMVPGILQGQIPAEIKSLSPYEQGVLGVRNRAADISGQKAAESKTEKAAKSGTSRQNKIAQVVNQADSAARSVADREAKGEYGDIDKAKWSAIYKQHFDSRLKAGIPDLSPEEYKKVMSDMFPEQTNSLDDLLLNFLKGGK